MTVITKTVHLCSDGKEFDSIEAAQAHENSSKKCAEAAYNNWVHTSYSGKKLLEKHSIDDYGMWKILGEDPNCDFGGHHHNPDLGTVEGRLDDVIRYAVSLDRFFTWGSGGDIVKISVKKV